MKKQNIIIVVFFLVLITVFNLISCDTSEEVKESIDDGVVAVDKYVDVILEGELDRTGMFNIPATWTVGALLSYAGIKETSDVSSFDLSSLVEDGATYYVPKITTQNLSYTSKLNINNANVNQLCTLNGIGESLALKIISYRQQTPFNKIEEIKNVSGIGDAIYQKIKDYITV